MNTERAKEILERLNHVEPMPGVEVAFEHPTQDPSEIIGIYIGTKWHGPVLSWRHDGWSNLYSNGNFGKNFVSGGTWGSQGGRNRDHYPTIVDALEHRDYMVGGSRYKRNEALEKELPLMNILGPALERQLPEITEPGGSLGELFERLSKKED